MKTLGLTLLFLAIPVVAADAPPPDVALWNSAAMALHQFGADQEVFVKTSTIWVFERQSELSTPGSVSLRALRAYGEMWAAWQRMEASHKLAAKAMHDFDVVERNRQ